MEEFLYDTFKKVVGSQKKNNSIMTLRQKCNNPFVDYRNSGTGFHGGLKMSNSMPFKFPAQHTQYRTLSHGLTTDGSAGSLYL